MLLTAYDGIISTSNKNVLAQAIQVNKCLQSCECLHGCLVNSTFPNKVQLILC